MSQYIQHLTHLSDVATLDNKHNQAAISKTNSVWCRTITAQCRYIGEHVTVTLFSL